MIPRTRNWVAAAAVSTALALATAMPGLAQEDDPDAAAQEAITVTGWLGDGVECPVVDADDGTRYGLTGEFDIASGAYVEVTGELFDVSTCMEGEGTIAVEEITEVDAPDETAPADDGFDAEPDAGLDAEPDAGLDTEFEAEPEIEPVE